MTDPRATQGQFASWNHPNMRIADFRLSWRRQHARRRALVLLGNGEPLAKIAEWLDLSVADVRSMVGLDGPEAA